MLNAAPGLRFWTGVRAVEGAALEMLFTSNRNVGSNPTLSVMATVCSLTIQSTDLINRTMQVPAGILPNRSQQ